MADLNWKYLKPGDVVDVIAPGFRTVTEDGLAGGIRFLESIGLKPRVPKNLYGKDVICSNRDEIRYEHLRKALSASDSQAVWCVRGGYGSIRLLPYLRKMKKPKSSKLLIGYSDITTVHNIINNEWGWPSIHGPMLDRLGSESPGLQERKTILDLIFGRIDEVQYAKLEALNVSAKSARMLKAPIVGGNIKVVEGELGTQWQHNPEGKFLFLEEIGERGYRIDRSLMHLQLAGYLDKVKAIFFGTITGGEEPNGQNHAWEVIERFANEIKCPVFRGLPVGHGDLQMPLPLGVEAVYTSKTLKIPTGGQKG